MPDTEPSLPSGRGAVTLPMFIIDAFAEGPLTGNPAAVCPLENWLPATTMQAIATEMNLSETVFFAPQNREDFGIRWFTPTTEVDLVGHARLAAGHLVLNRMRPGTTTVRFLSSAGTLTVTRDGDSLALEMPALRPRPIKAPHELVRGLGRQPTTGASRQALSLRFRSCRRRRQPRPRHSGYRHIGLACCHCYGAQCRGCRLCVTFFCACERRTRGPCFWGGASLSCALLG
jgi:hypothetical protein